jgi:glycosyltransferase involved in cell wall biosynthesis
MARETSMVSMNKARVKFPWIYNRLVKKYYRRFDHIICQSVYMQHDLVQHYHIAVNKTTVIHNAVDAVLSNDPAKDRAAQEEYKFITVSRLSEEKGIERLIHAVGLLTLPFKFYIIGDGDKKEYLQKLICKLQLQDKIFLKGEKKDPFAGMQDAGLFLMGSFYEGFPNVLLEAGSYGIPVIAFNVPGGIGEIIREGENGLLVEDNDLPGFAAAINKAVISGFDRNKIIESTQKRFSISEMMRKLEDILLQL